MNKEEGKTIAFFKSEINLLRSGQNFKTTDEFSRLNFKRDLEIILNLIQKQEKIIDELKNHIYYKNCIACGKEFKAKRKDAKYCAYCSRSITNRAYYLSLTEEQKQKRREQAKLCMRRIRAERKVDNETV